MNEMKLCEINENIKHFDQPAFLEKLLGNRELFDELVGYACQQVPDELQNIKKACETKNAEKARNIAHKLKGTALNMCFGPFAELAIKFEEICGSDESTAHSLFNKMELEWKNIKAEIESGSK